MTNVESAFHRLATTLTKEPGITLGKMMSSPGIQYNGKVFVFFWKDNMIFRLGNDYDLENKFGITEYEYLSPFKNKPPMKGWYVIGGKYSDLWAELANEALMQFK